MICLMKMKMDICNDFNTLTLYCVGYGDNIPQHQQYNQKNIMAGAYSLDSQKRIELENKGFLFDDVGDNISSLNYTFGDLTATYWVWKNAKEEFLGTNQYRRFWNENEIDLNALDDKTIYVTKYDKSFISVSVLDQYIACHGNLGIEILNELFDDKNFILKKHLFYRLNETREINTCNMFFCHRNIYDKFCELLFEILFQVYEKGKSRIENIEGYQKRLIAFLSERIITSLIYNSGYYFSNLNVKTINYRQL